MPMPAPKKGEKHEDFMGRCMNSEAMQSEYPDQKQRYAVCQSQWDEKKSAEGMIEHRSFNLEELSIRDEGETRKIIGHAAIFADTYNAPWFRERIKPGAFTDSLGKDDIRALWNHDSNFVLGRKKAGTLSLREDEKGLAIEITPPNSQWARDMMVSIERGDVSQMSFGFEALKDEWDESDETKDPLRTLLQVKLWEVSPVTFPAYANTDVGVRSLVTWRNINPKPQYRKSPFLRRMLSLKLKS
jgi:hypothetical protein